jgi:hypothetical protein
MLAVLLAGFSYLNEYSLTGICIVSTGDTGDVSGVVCLLSILLFKMSKKEGRRKMTSSRYMIHDLT